MIVKKSCGTMLGDAFPQCFQIFTDTKPGRYVKKLSLSFP